MVSTLIVFPGSGDPNNERYSPTYKLISREAAKRGYENVVIPIWMGQFSHSDKKKFLNLPQSVKTVQETLKKYEDLGEKYDVICRSYGCSVFMEAVRPLKLLWLGKAVLWGPSPLYNFYRLFYLHEKETQEESLKKGVRVDSEVFKTMFPFELHIEQFNRGHYASDIKLRIATGTLDKHCIPAFIQFLKNGFGSEKIDYQIVEGVAHGVQEYHQDYLNVLFGDF